MKRNLPLAFFLFAAFALCCNLLQAQNLVLNPGFQNFSSCPQGISQFSLCTNWSTTTTVASDTCSTPDLYATCASSLGGVNIPNCLLGYHQPYTGTGFAGQILGDGLPGCIPTGDNYREYIEGKLSTPLVAGQHYSVVVYMSLADQSMWGSNSYGIYFSNSLYIHDACPNSIINVTPQLEMCGPAIMDTVNWVPVSWIYTATGGEQYMTLGNFNNDANTNHVTHNCGSFNPYIYYYIGYVSVTPAGPNNCGVSLTTDSVNATCGSNNGVVEVKANGCTTPFTYLWSNNATTSRLTNVGPGTYSVTVTDVTNCHETTSVSVNSNPLLITSTGTNPLCGGTNGSASISVINGTGPYTYSWSNGGTTATLNNLSTGDYYVTVNGAVGCLAHDSVSLLSSSGLTVTPAITGAGCGGNGGSVTANVTGGSAPYTFNWSNGQTTQTINNLSVGNYSVTVVGDTSSGAPFWSDDFTSGGTTWTLNTAGQGTNGNSANRWIVNNDNSCTCGSGNYLHITNTTNSSCLECLIMPAGTCQYLELASTFGEGDFSTDVLAISPVISTLGKSNITLSFDWESLGTDGSDYGLVDLSNNGGTTWTALPFQYVDSANCSHATVAIPVSYQNSANFRFAFEWINGPGSFGNAGNPPGFVVDNVALTAAASNCPAIASVTVPASSGINLTITPTPPSCGLKNGALTANVTGSTGTLTYAWNNGGTAQSITGLGAGNYNVTVTSSSGCSVTGGAALFVGSGNLSAVTASTPATCGNNNGSASVTAVGASGYIYQWSNSATSAVISNVGAGSYTVTVTADNGACSASATALVATSNSLILNPTGTATTCGGNNGSATVTVSSGTGPFTYAWSTGSTAANVSNLNAGSYRVTVTANGGCSGTATVVIDTSSAIRLQAFGGRAGCISSGTASVNVISGNGPFTYLWSNAATASSINSLSAGTYSVTVTGADNCSASALDTVISTGTGITLAPSTTASLCSTPTGAANVTATTGNGPFNYAWSNGQTSDTILNVAAGSYAVTVTGSSGCSATASLTVPTSGTLSLTTTATNAACGTNNGSSYAVIGGNLLSIYNWSNGATSDTISGLAPGTYSVTATTPGGCSATANSVINQSGDSITLPAPNSICQGDTAHICAPSGYSTYHWNTGSTSQCINATQAGNYYVTVTQNGSCTATSNHITLTITAPGTITIVQRGDSLIATGGNAYQWYLGGVAIAGATSAVYIPVQDGNYSAHATDGNGCKENSNSLVVTNILGITQVDATGQIKVYPNPLANGNWHLEVSAEWIGADCEVYDAEGKVVYRTEIKSAQTEFDMNVAQGVYLMRINSAQKSYTFKLIKL